MGWFIINASNGTRWAFNNDGIYLTIRAVVRANLIRARSSVVSTSHGAFLPTTYCLETDWNGFRDQVDEQTNHLWANAEMQLRGGNPSAMMGSLVGMVTSARTDIAWMHNKRVMANQRSQASIGFWVGAGEAALEIATFVRNASATILVVAGGIATGGTGAAAFAAVGGTGATATTAMGSLALGSAMRGAFTYQDTGNVGSAAINTVGTFTVGAIGLSAPAASLMSGAEAATILTVQAVGQGATTGGQALAEGRNLRDAAVASAVSAGFGAAAGPLGRRVEAMSFVTQVGTVGLADLGGNMAAGAAIAPASAPLTRPAAPDDIDYGPLPRTSGAEAAYVAQNCVFQIMAPVAR